LALIFITLIDAVAGSAAYREMVETFGLRASAWSWQDPASYGRMVTYAFLHGSGMHFLGNAVVLLLAGTVVETRIGFRASGFFLLVGTIVAAAAHLAFFPGETRMLIGASGGVATIMGAAFIVAGESGFTLRVPPLQQALLLTLRRVLLFWLALQVIGLILALQPGQPAPGVAYWGHLAGFAAGAIGAGAYRRFASRSRQAATEPLLGATFGSAGN
jgi:membrane associated rhomboid family serine protease